MKDLLTSAAIGGDLTVPRYHLVDLVVSRPEHQVEGNPFDLDLSATFRGPHDRIITVPGFYDLDLGFVVRFSPEAVGNWSYSVTSTDATLNGRGGSLTCVADDLPSWHGPLKVDQAHPHHFLWGDDTRCFLMGYEANWLMAVDQEPSDLTRVNEMLDDLVTYGFNMVTVNAYAYVHPSRWDVTWQESGDPIFVTPTIAPWVGSNAEPDYAQMNAAYFAHCDRIMIEMLRRGLLAHLMIHVYNKGIPWPEMCSADDNRYWRYVVARYQAFANIILDPGKETFNRPATYVQDRIRFIKSLDGYQRITTVHDPCHMKPWHDWPYHRRNWDPEREVADGMVDFKSDQIHLFWYEDAVGNYRAAERPYVNIEYGYETGMREIPTNNPLRVQHWREVLRRSWLVAMGGGYINYYYLNTAWTVFLQRPIPPGYAAHLAYRKFWESTSYWLLAPDNAPVGNAELVYCRCNPGQEYVVFDEAGRGFDLDATGDGVYNARWFNPVGDEYVDAGRVSAGKETFRSPFGRGCWAVLHLKRQ